MRLPRHPRCSHPLSWLALCGVAVFAVYSSLSPELHAQVAELEAPQSEATVQTTQINEGLTALDEYVAEPDSTYAWEIVNQKSIAGVTVYVIDLKSQTWRTEADVDRTVWQHWLTVVVPDGATSDTALMIIGGGSNGGQPPKRTDPMAAQVAIATKTVVASISMIPNQPLVFHQDGVGRKEDDLIAYTWDQYLKTGDTLWAARLPMTKAVVRGMDTVQKLTEREDYVGPKVENFVVAGGSKRGWTTWTTAIVDKRVKAIAPIVIDVLNTNVSMQHHYSAYGFWAPAIGDYQRHRIMERRFTSRYQELLQLVDPFAYRDRITIPKCIINATGDQFFLPDSSQFYFDDLVGEKNLCYVPNGDHSLNKTNALDTLIAFHHSIVNEIERPSFSWSFPSPNKIRVEAETKPKRVLLWKAVNKETRDFRVDTIGRAYKASTLKPQDDGSYLAHVETPEKGWAAFLVQLEFEVGAPTKLRLTTPVRVVPEELPFANKVAPVTE